MWVDLSDILCMEPFQHTAVERLAEGSDILLALVGSEYLDQDLDDSKAKEIIILLNKKKKQLRNRNFVTRADRKSTSKT